MATDAVFERVYRLFGANLQEIAGSMMSGEIPLSDALLNRFIADALAGKQIPVTAVRLESQDDGRLAAHVSIRGPRIVPQITVAARIEQQPEFPESPVLGLRWSLPGFGPLGLFAAPFLSHLKTLPAGIRIDGDRLLVDVAEIFRARGLGEALQYIRRLHIGTRPGRLIVTFDLRA